jgi:hypothetical protein
VGISGINGPVFSLPCEKKHVVVRAMEYKPTETNQSEDLIPIKLRCIVFTILFLSYELVLENYNTNGWVKIRIGRLRFVNYVARLHVKIDNLNNYNKILLYKR